MRNLLVTALLVLGLGSTAAIPVTAPGQTDTRPSSAQHQQARPRQSAQPFLVVGLTTDQTLVAFASNTPTKPTTLGPIRGLQGDQRLVGIDCRVPQRPPRPPPSHRPSPPSTSTSTRPPTGSASSATPARTCATTWTTPPAPPHQGQSPWPTPP